MMTLLWLATLLELFFYPPVKVLSLTDKTLNIKTFKKERTSMVI